MTKRLKAKIEKFKYNKVLQSLNGSNPESSLSQEEKSKLRKFSIFHDCKYKLEEDLTRVKFSFSPIGTRMDAKCICAAEEDITDYELW